MTFGSGGVKMGPPWLIIFIITSIALPVFGQIQFTEVSELVGVDYNFSSVSYMGGGAAFFDFDNDGDEDIWIAGGIGQDVLFENDGTGQFKEIGYDAGLGASNGHVTSGVITGDLDNDGFKDVVLLPHIGFHPLLFRNNGDGTFTEISVLAGLSAVRAQSHAGVMGDINLDGFLDIYVVTYIKNIGNDYDGSGAVVGFDHDCHDNLLFINNGDWTFTEQSQAYGVKNGGCGLAAVFTDFDQDADPDLMIANDFGEWIRPNALYQNELPGGSLTDISDSTGANPGIYGMGIAIGDYDQDQDLDYYITNLGRNILLVQDQEKFTDQTTSTGIEDTYMGNVFATGWGTAFADVDNDTDLDLFVTNGYVPAALFIDNHKQNRNRLYINNGNEEGEGFNFEEVSTEAGLDDPGRGRGFTYADYDNDGDLDFLVVNVNQHTSGDPMESVKLFRNDNDNGKSWLKVKLEGTISNRDAFGASIKIVVGNRSWIHDYNGGYGTHASQHSAIAHFGLRNAAFVDSLTVVWPGGSQFSLLNIPSNQQIVIKESGDVLYEKDPSDFVESIPFTVTPNLISQNARIYFRLQKGTQVQLEVFDVWGKKLTTIQQQWFEAGNHTIEWSPTGILTSAGAYLIRLKTAQQINTRKIVYTP